MSEIKTKTAKDYAILCIAAVLLLLAVVAPPVGALTKPMVSLIFLFIMGILLWVTLAIPIAATSLLVTAMVPLLKITPSLGAAFTGYANPTQYFIVASFALGMAIGKTTITSRMLVALLKISKGKISIICLSLMSVAGLISMFLSDVATVVIMLYFVYDLSKLIENEESKAKLMRLMMIALPFGSMIVGSTTTVGGTTTVMAVNMLRAHNGFTIYFFQWLIVAFPPALCAHFFAWFMLTKIFKADDIPQDVVHKFLKEVKYEAKAKNEPVTVFIIFLIIALWILEAWLPIFDTTTSAIFGFALLFLVGALTWDEFRDGMSWEVPLMGGAVTGLGTAALNLGLVKMVTDGVMSAFPSVNPFGLIVIYASLITAVLIFVPVGPAMVAMLAVPGYILAESLGIGLHPLAMVILTGTFAGNTSVVPLSATFLISYTKGHWKATELFKVGIPISIVWILLSGVWIPFAAKLVYGG